MATDENTLSLALSLLFFHSLPFHGKKLPLNSLYAFLVRPNAS